MKTVEVVKAIALVALVFVLQNALAANKKFISIQKALENNLVCLQLTSLGAHTGNCVQSKTKNLTNDSLFIVFETGRKLDNTDDSQQDILMVQEIKLTIAPHKTKDTTLFGYCCQSNNACPKFNQQIRLGRMADSGSVHLSRYLNLHRKISDSYAAQSAVWCFSNNHEITSIGETSDSLIFPLIQFCCKEKKLPPPTFHVKYLAVAGRVFSNIPQNITTNITFNKRTNGVVKAFVCDSLGNVIKTLVDNNFAGQSTLKFHFSFQVLNWNKGKYFIKIFENGEESKSQEFQI